MKAALNIRQEYILPLPFRVFGFFLVLIGLGASGTTGFNWIAGNSFSWWIPGGVLAALLGGAIAFSHYRLEIKTDIRTIDVYVWILGFHHGSPSPFQYIDRIYINRVLQSTRMSSYTGHPSEMKEYLYKAYLKLDDGEKIHMDTDNNEEVLMQRVKNYVAQLGKLYRGTDFKD